MNRVTSLAALRRAAAATASLSRNQAAPLSSSSFTTPYFLPRRLIHHSGSASSASHSLSPNSIAGTMFFSVAAAASLSQEAHAKESLHSNLFNDVVLYQYEACPFCNKVKGTTTIFFVLSTKTSHVYMYLMGCVYIYIYIMVVCFCSDSFSKLETLICICSPMSKLVSV